MADSRAEITTTVLQILQDAGAATYIPAETTSGIHEGLKELARYDPHLVDVIFKIESRRGTDTGSTGTNLTDTTKSQFLTTDASLEKVVHNTTDHTWAVIKTHTSDSVQVLTVAIMASGEKYEIYNKRCRNSKQIYIGDVSDYLWVDSVEYPIGTKRNFTIYDYILEIDIDRIPDSNLNVTGKPDLDVLIRFAKTHKLCVIDDVDGLVKTTGVVAATSILVDGFTNGETVEIGDEFNIEDHRTLYTVTKGILLAAQTGIGSTFYFTPSLEAAAEGDKIITFRKSSLQIHHEELFCNLVAARIAISKGSKFLQQLQTALTTLTNVDGIINTMTAEITQATNDLASGRTAAALTPAIITKAETAISLIGNQINPAIANMHTGQALINEINKGAQGQGVPTSYANYATTALNNARAYADQARVNLQQATSDESVARSYIGLATGELNKANSQLSQAGGYIREITSRLNVASSSRLYSEWGERKLFEAKTRLETLRPPKTKRSYPTD